MVGTADKSVEGDLSFSWRKFMLGMGVILVIFGYPIFFLFYNVYSVLFLHTYISIHDPSSHPIDLNQHFDFFLFRLIEDCLLYVPCAAFAAYGLVFAIRVIRWKYRTWRRDRLQNG